MRRVVRRLRGAQAVLHARQARVPAVLAEQLVACKHQQFGPARSCI